MRKQLRKAALMGTLLVMAFVVLFVAAVLRQDVEVDRGNLLAILNTARGWTGEASRNLHDLSLSIASSAPSLRVTFLLPNGVVLADSEGNYEDGARLLGQPAARSALRTGIGDAVSWQTGLLSPTLYAAAELGDGQMLLHLSNQDTEIREVMKFVAPGLVLLFALVYLSLNRILQPVTGRLISQLEQVRGLLEGTVEREQIDPAEYYPELRQTLEVIGRLIDRLRHDLSLVRRTLDMQRDFVDNTSHELKSPLTSILGFAQMLDEEENLTPEKRRAYLGYILQDATRMMAVIENILLLQKDAPQQEEDRTMVYLRHTAEEVRQSLQPQCSERGIMIHLEGSLRLHAREQDMWDLLRNLMANAVHYGRQGGYVQVAMAGRELSVRDNGIGISAEHLPRIFEKFYRAEDAHSSTAPGTGLGLSIVAGIVNRYGGSIHVDSTEREGSCFTICFPLDSKEGPA
ncbi:MAG: hypothetical protein GX653_08750 [Clostridiales bacterium]|nr:hypothetical protein [Clostridiales bacterium]